MVRGGANTFLVPLLNSSVSSISWLENEVILVAHTPSSANDGMPPPTTHHVITRHPKQTPPLIMYQRLPEVVGPFGQLERSPSFQFTQRLRDFPPNLDDVIIVASTSSVDIGLITKSKTPLSDNAPPNAYTTTLIAEDSRRAQMPMSEDLTDTSPIGLALDLSSKDNVQRPLPTEEYDVSQSPLPAVMVLNNEGILSAWWFVYAESIREGTTFPGLTVAGGIQAPQQSQVARQASPLSNAGPRAALSTFGKPSVPAASPFGGAFNKTSELGPAAPVTSVSNGMSLLGKPSSTTSATTQNGGSSFGQPSFGTPSSMGPTTQGTAFGMAAGFGSRSSPWGAASTTGTAAATGSAFGQTGFNAPKVSPFGAPPARDAASAPASGGFSSFASKPSGFMTVAPSSGNESIFGKSSDPAPLGSGMDTDTNFGAPAKNDGESTKAPFASGTFTLGSTFKGDGSSANDKMKPTSNSGGSMFGGDFGDALRVAPKEALMPSTKDADMDEEDDVAPAEKTQPTTVKTVSTTPSATPAPLRSNFPTPSVPPKTGGLFGTQSQSTITPAAVGSSQPTGFGFGKPSPTTTTPIDNFNKANQPQQAVETSPKIKEEPHSEDGGDISPLNETESAPPLHYGVPETPPGSTNPEAPLPPESTSKASFAPGDSSNSSKSSDDAPLPPDFIPSKTKLKDVEAAPPEEAALPSGDEGEEFEGISEDGDDDNDEAEGETDDDEGNIDDEGSGIDVAQEISPTTDPNQSPKITPESSFGAPNEKSPSTGGLFGRITAPPDRQKGLFGEVGKTSAPYLPPPTKTQQSPRSPSPVRLNRLGDSLRPDSARSISAPGPFQALNNRKAALNTIAVPSKPQPSSGDIRRQVREQMAAEQARIRAEEEQDLSDREDERVREELATDVDGTLTLDPFLAHQDYLGEAVKPGVPGQIEKVYRDVNSMIDTLGLNARSLKAFMKGHEETGKNRGARDRDDLENDDWSLIEIRDLPDIENGLSAKLETGRTQGVQEKLDECRDVRKEIKTLRAKGSDIVRVVDTHTDPDEVESARTAPLSLDQATQQHELRKKMAKFQKLLAETEENITMLRTKLASCDTTNSTGPPLKKPTVEAVTNTIKKMTSIIEKKNVDVDILENQMRHLRFSFVANQSSREGSPFNPASSTSRRRPASRMGTSNMHTGHSHLPSRGSLLGRSVNGEGTPRKGVAEVTPEEVQRYQDKSRRRREINVLIREAFEKTGPRIKALD